MKLVSAPKSKPEQVNRGVDWKAGFAYPDLMITSPNVWRDSMPKWVISEDLCKGCGICALECPGKKGKKAIVMEEEGK